MRASRILRRQLEPALTFLHGHRRQALLDATDALLRGGQLPLSSLGRALAGSASDKHRIKRIDRLLGNAALQEQVPQVYQALVRLLVQPGTRPLILLDWTEAGMDRFALSAVLPFEGRPLPLYHEVHPLRLMSNRSVLRHFLLRLRRLLPPDCRPVLVTDAGFRAPWFHLIYSLGWDFVGRVRGGVLVQADPQQPWRRSHELFPQATRTARDLGVFALVRGRPYIGRLVLVRKRPLRKRPSRRHLPRRITEQRCAEAAREPWLLCTSLDQVHPAQVAAIYSLRMQIEQLYRDTKSHRFGWGLEDVRSGSEARVSVLLLIASLATFAVTLAGFAAERLGLHLSYQANTLRSRRVLSLFTLGRLVLCSRCPGSPSPRYGPSVLLALLRLVPCLSSGT